MYRILSDLCLVHYTCISFVTHSSTKLYDSRFNFGNVKIYGKDKGARRIYERRVLSDILKKGTFVNCKNTALRGTQNLNLCIGA